MRKSRRVPIKTKPTFVFVVDGKTEVWYLNMLMRNERDIRVTIKPEIPHRKSLKDQYKLVCDLSEKEFSKVFWIVDFDTIIKEDKEALKGKTSPLKLFKEYRTHLIEKCKNVVVIVNNPCLEFWFLLHFSKTAKQFNNCSNAERELKKHLINYEKSQRYFTKQNDDIYLKLKPYLKTALDNSMALGNFDDDNPQRAMCEMELLFNSVF